MTLRGVRLRFMLDAPGFGWWLTHSGRMLGCFDSGRVLDEAR